MSQNAYRLYGRQKARPLKANQQELLEQLLPDISVDIQEISRFPKVVLEIGFGGGEHVMTLAMNNPDTLYIAVEPFINGVCSLLSYIDEHEIKNIRIFNGDVRNLYSELPAGSFDEIYLLFPDPWPKKRHWKRRFIQTTTFDQMSTLLKTNGKWYIATDHPSYQEWIDDMFKSDACINRFTYDNPTTLMTPWSHIVETRYKQKAIREGRAAQYYVLAKKSV